jgi:hypothetical protein
MCLCVVSRPKNKPKTRRKREKVNPIQFNSFGGIHPTSTDPVSPYSCSTTFPILTDVPSDPQSRIAIYCLVLQLFLRVGIVLLPPGPNQAPDLTNHHVGPGNGDPTTDVAQ